MGGERNSLTQEERAGKNEKVGDKKTEIVQDIKEGNCITLNHRGDGNNE